jgi:ABC-type nitrate/sulfonate/bicarbonate transport system permease component
VSEDIVRSDVLPAEAPKRAPLSLWLRLIDIGRELLPFAVGVAIWQALSSLNIWPPVLFPSPLQVFWSFVADIKSGALPKALSVSLVSLAYGFLIGAAIALPLGYLMGLNRASRNFFDPLVNLLQAIPGLAWIPFAILWFGLGQGAVIFIIVMSVFFPVLHNLLTGIRLVQPVLVEASQTLGASRWAIIVHVIFPSTLPNLMTGIRLGIAFGFRSLVGGEMIASTDGIGYQIFNAQQYFQSARIVVGMLAIGIVWLLLDRLVLRPIETHTTMRWGLMREGIENT